MRYQIIDTHTNRIMAETDDPIEAEMIVKEHELLANEPDTEMERYFRDYWAEEVRKAHANMEDLDDDIIEIILEDNTCIHSKTA